ncbi:MAG TPA: thioredoxin family protein, partial [Solirubrobacteraceae bacterium]|nr:thioredoxin family protein [Solirubrobacteraceae bacterium]
ERRLTKLRGRARFRPRGGGSRRAAPGHPGAPAASLENLGVAPSFTGTQRWFNTHGRALSLGSLRGRVVLVDFWTYTCINCLRTLPFLKTLDARYRAAGLTVVGVHTPEFDFEHEAGNVAAAIRREGIRYPVVQDNNYATWNAYGNQYWPAEYLIDAAGNVRHVHFGEGEYAKSEAAVRALLAERGVRRLGLPSGAHGTSVSTRAATPETYLGAKKATGFVGDAPRLGTHTYRELRAKLPTNAFALGGSWRIGADQATAASGASIDVAFQARKVFLVLSATAGGGDVKVLLDRRRIAAAERGSDVARGRVHVRGQRLYELVSLPRVERRRLTLRLRPGVSAYAFTFG